MDQRRLVEVLDKLGLDAYVIYDFRGSNFVGRDILGFKTFTTRRFVSVLGHDGVSHIVSKMEAKVFENLLGEKLYFSTYSEYENLIKQVLGRYAKIALDYSPENSLPILDLTPKGFIELLVRELPQTKIVSSADVTQYLAAVWGQTGYQSHKKATNGIASIFDEAFDMIREHIKNKQSITDLETMKFVVEQLGKRGLHNDGENICIVATRDRTANPHYWPQEGQGYDIESNSPLLIDIWARTKDEGSVYSDFTQYAWVGPEPVPQKILKAWDAWQAASDVVLEKLGNKLDIDVRGFELDLVARKVLEERGFGNNLLHRTGHSLGTKEHGNGANLDDFETHDTRLIIPGSGFSIEPGIYLSDLGVRAEMNVYIHEDGLIEVTTPEQKDINVI